MKLIGWANNYWYLIESFKFRKNKPTITDWVELEMKEKVREKYVF